ncbi:MAG: hypothetical protein P8X89_14775 [Reinekea sp.]
MARALIRRTLTEDKLNQCFERAVDKQYTHDLLFDSAVRLLKSIK